MKCIVLLITLIAGCTGMTQSKIKTLGDERPEGFVEPKTQALIEAKNLIDSEKFIEAVNRLDEFVPGEILDKYWKNYLLGLAYFGEKKLEDGAKHLESCYEDVKQEKDVSANLFRLVGLCLKKLGWYHRNKKEYLEAVAYHTVRYNYVKQFGSNLDVHDALISLDVDVYFMKDLYLSEQVLTESVKYGELIVNDKDKFMALGITYNNLSGTSYGLKKFEQAEDAIKRSLKYWEQYEVIAGKGEFKVVWAHFGVGDVYENWTKSLKESGAGYAGKKAAALAAYQKSLNLADERHMSEADRKFIKDRLDAVNAL